MTAKRFTLIKGTGTDECILDNIYDNGTYIGAISGSGSEMICYLLNALHEENQQIKNLIHTMLRQIDTENITSDSAKYSARIIFSRNEFNLIRKLWEKELEK